MKEYFQGDIVKINGFKNKFVIVSKNAFIKYTERLHVSPIIEGLKPGPTHIAVQIDEKPAVIICEEIKLIDPEVRTVSNYGRLTYQEIMEVSDTIQGIFEYD